MARGIDTTIVSTTADGPGRLPLPTGVLTTWQDVPALFFDRDFGVSLKYSRRLGHWLRANVSTFDVVHIHAVMSHACLAAASACHRQDVPYVLRPLGTLAPWSLGQKAFKKRVVLLAGARSAVVRAAAVHCTSRAERLDVDREFPTATRKSPRSFFSCQAA